MQRSRQCVAFLMTTMTLMLGTVAAADPVVEPGAHPPGPRSGVMRCPDAEARPRLRGMQHADSNADGILTRAELEGFERAQQERRARQFESADRDHDGRLVGNEWRAYRQALHAEGMHPGHPGCMSAAPAGR